MEYSYDDDDSSFTMIVCSLVSKRNETTTTTTTADNGRRRRDFVQLRRDWAKWPFSGSAAVAAAAAAGKRYVDPNGHLRIRTRPVTHRTPQQMSDKDDEEWAEPIINDATNLIVRTTTTTREDKKKMKKGSEEEEGGRGGRTRRCRRDRTVVDEDRDIVGASSKDKHINTLDEVLRLAVLDVHKRSVALKLEGIVIKFMKSRTEEIRLPPIAGYHRLLLHKIAERFNLQSRTLPPPTTTTTSVAIGGRRHVAVNDRHVKRGLIVRKTEDSWIPNILLADCTERARRTTPVAIMGAKKSTNRPRNKTQYPTSSSSTGTVSGTDRERRRDVRAEYDEARRKIFGSESETNEKNAVRNGVYSKGPPADGSVGFSRRGHGTKRT